MITVADFPSLTVTLQSIFMEVASSKVAESKGFQVFNTFDTERRTYDHLILHGVAGIQRVTPGQDLPRVTSRQGDTVSWTQEFFGAIVPIDKEMRKFDLYNDIEKLCRSVVEDAFDKVDQSLADKMTKGWSTSYTDVYGDTVSSVGPDGLALFSLVHTNNISSDTASNIISDGTNTNPPLSRVAIVYMRALFAKHRDPNNLVRSINLDSLLVSPDNEDLAERICMSEYLPGSANNDKNPLKGKIKNILVWPRLALAADGTDTSAYWFMFDSMLVKETLNCLFAERPSLDPPQEAYSNKNWDYSVDYFYAIGLGYPMFVVGSKGDNS